MKKIKTIIKKEKKLKRGLQLNLCFKLITWLGANSLQTKRPKHFGRLSAVINPN